MNENGLIVDDPFGRTILNKGMTRKNKKGEKVGNYAIDRATDDGTKLGWDYGGKDVEGTSNEGEDNLWTWKALKEHGTWWVRIVK